MHPSIIFAVDQYQQFNPIDTSQSNPSFSVEMSMAELPFDLDAGQCGI
jgi:hypothetical protein